MKKIWIIVLFLAGWQITAQDETDKKLLDIDRQINEIIAQKSKQFQARLDTINFRLKQGNLSPEDAEFQKKQLAKHYAEDLDYAIYKLTKDLKQVAKGRVAIDSTVNQDAGYTVHQIQLNLRHQRDYTVHKNKNTYAYAYFTAGLNNILTHDDPASLEDTPYGILNSRFFEMGIDWKTNVIHHRLLLKYGFSLLWNTLKPSGNKYHIMENDRVMIVEHPYHLSRSKLRSLWVKLPLALELNLPEANRQHLRLSAGVYGKIRYASKQKITYYEDNERHKQKIKGNYSIPAINYGLSAEIGGTTWSVYVNYDLKPFFSTRPGNLLNLGVKFEL